MCPQSEQCHRERNCKNHGLFQLATHQKFDCAAGGDLLGALPGRAVLHLGYGKPPDSGIIVTGANFGNNVRNHTTFSAVHTRFS